MDVVALIMGLSLIGIGFLVKKYPGLISGYNTMSEKKKKNVDIEELSSFMKKWLVILGGFIIVTYFIFKFLGFVMIAQLMSIIPMLIGVFVITIVAQKFDHNKKKKRDKILLYTIMVVTIVFVASLMFSGNYPTRTTITDQSVTFLGMYGTTINISDIADVQLADNIPAIRMKTNGFAMGGVAKGFFKLDDYGRCRLFIHNGAPFMIITNNKGVKTIISNSDSAVTKADYEKLKKIVSK